VVEGGGSLAGGVSVFRFSLGVWGFVFLVVYCVGWRGVCGWCGGGVVVSRVGWGGVGVGVLRPFRWRIIRFFFFFSRMTSMLHSSLIWCEGPFLVFFILTFSAPTKKRALHYSLFYLGFL